MEAMKDMGMTDSQYKSMRRRDKKELERILEAKAAEEKDSRIRAMLEMIQQDLKDWAKQKGQAWAVWQQLDYRSKRWT